MTNNVNKKSFKTLNNLELIVKNRKSAVIFEIKDAHQGIYKFELSFDSETFYDLLNYIKFIAGQSWSNLTPKEAGGMGADYSEYYDKELDNNGYLSIKKNLLLIERPSSDSNKLYQFNKNKMESFIYDFMKL